MNEEAIRLASAGRTYRAGSAAPVKALDNVSLCVKRGEFVAIQGPSGSGKTTLLGLLAGIEKTDSGSVFVLGHDLGRLGDDELARLRRSKIGVVFQSFGLLAALSAGENVALPLALDGVAESERMVRAKDALAEVGLDTANTARIDELSGGERQRVAVARALIASPALVLADEPTGSLDEANGRMVLELLQRVTRARGATLVIVTHDPGSAAMADRRYRLSDGHLAEVDSAAELAQLMSAPDATSAPMLMETR